MRRVLTYAKAFGVLVAHRPADPWLSGGAAATRGRVRRAHGPAQRPGHRREDHAGARPGAGGADRRAAAGRPDHHRGARWRACGAASDKGLPVVATTSINHLSFNEIDIGDYRTFCKLDPPLRSEDDRQAVIEAVASGLIEVVVSAHAPAPAEDKRLPYDEAAPGAVGLQTLLPALLTFHHEGRIPLIDLIRAVTSAPADLLGLPAGRLAKGAPADLVLCDLDAPLRDRRRQAALEVQELALRRPPAAGQGAADGGGRPDGLRGLIAPIWRGLVTKA